MWRISRKMIAQVLNRQATTMRSCTSTPQGLFTEGLHTFSFHGCPALASVVRASGQLIGAGRGRGSCSVPQARPQASRQRSGSGSRRDLGPGPRALAELLGEVGQGRARLGPLLAADLDAAL